MPTYPHDAACATSPHPAHTWDNEVAGETPTQRAARIETAKTVCHTCPVTDECHARRWNGGGIRAGRVHPDRIPGYEGDLYAGINHTGRPIVICGTDSGYQKHLRLRETPCSDCKIAHSRRVIELRQARRAVA